MKWLNIWNYAVAGGILVVIGQIVKLGKALVRHEKRHECIADALEDICNKLNIKCRRDRL